MTKILLVSQSLHHLLHGSLSNVKLHYDFPNDHSLVFRIECINFLLITFCSGGWSTAVMQIDDVPVAIFEVFHPLLHSAGTMQYFA
jgi:hypothetical protein